MKKKKIFTGILFHCHFCSTLKMRGAMKKTALLTVILFLVALLVGCSMHNMVQRAALAPTCTEAGNTEYLECVHPWCSYKEGYEVIAPLGHSFEPIEAKAATEHASGHSAYEECSVCHEKKGYQEIFYIYEVCELLPDADKRPLVINLDENLRSELVGIYDAIMRFDENYLPQNKLSVSELSMIMKYFDLVFPELIQYANSFNYSHIDGHVANLFFDYTMSKSEYSDAMSALNESVSEIKAAVDQMTDFEKELYIHDHIVDVCEYEINADHSSNAYGALVLGKAKCDGYSRAFALLMMATGEECYTVSGTADGGPHAWNVVLVEDSYYNVDVTWDDGEAKYAYFNINDAIFNRTHTAQKYEVVIPDCDNMALSVPLLNGSHIFADEDILTRLNEIAQSESQKDIIDVHIRAETEEQFIYLVTNVGLVFTNYISPKYGNYKYSIFIHDGAGYVRFVVTATAEE